MTFVTEEQMHRPLFEEPTHSIEREDEWSAPFGFMVGGAANQEYPHLAEQYFTAAETLVEAVKLGLVEDITVANPVLYLYRHAIELYLKANMKGSAKTHSLDELAEEYREFIKKEFDADIPEWIVARMKELGAIDPNSTAFRYNLNFDRKSKRDRPVDGEYHVDLQHLQSAMRVLGMALLGTIAAVACGEGKSAS